MTTIIYFAVLAVLFLWLAYITFWRDKWIRNRRFPTQWLAVLESNLPVYPALSAEQQTRLQQLVLLFIAKKRFYGCGGLEMSDEIRVTVAAEACLLLLNKGWNVYPGLLSILVYPSAFRAQREQMREDGTVALARHNLLGESWSNGKVILSWDDVSHGIADFTDGHNVVLHEFAHQLDGQSGGTNGAPPLRNNSYKAWAHVFSDNFEDLRSRSRHGQKTVLDEYGATNPAEFFAVATETFFERPHALFKRRPELYDELQRYYQVDPRDWHEPG